MFIYIIYITNLLKLIKLYSKKKQKTGYIKCILNGDDLDEGTKVICKRPTTEELKFNCNKCGQCQNFKLNSKYDQFCGIVESNKPILIKPELPLNWYMISLFNSAKEQESFKTHFIKYFTNFSKNILFSYFIYIFFSKLLRNRTKLENVLLACLVERWITLIKE